MKRLDQQHKKPTINPEQVVHPEPKGTEKDFKIMKHPDPKKHQRISFIKSAVRIAGYVFIPFSLPLAAAVLILSEFIGILEELV